MILRISDDAERDLDGIFEYWRERVSLETANRLLDNIGERFSLIRRHPLAGASRAEFGADIRAFCAGNYVIYYRTTKQRILILRVLHGARNQHPAFRSTRKHR